MRTEDRSIFKSRVTLQISSFVDDGNIPSAFPIKERQL